VHKLLIEAKASGISAAQELRNRFGYLPFSVQLVPVKGDKVARALAVQPTFSQGLVYAPARDWSELVITQMSMFPKARHDDLTDSATQALKYLRDVGLAQTDTEKAEAEREAVTHRPGRRLSALYPC
jgi:predicted phage terminase large subunit-like protein